MRLLLDTHAVIWAMRAPEKLSPTARGAISDPSNELQVSAVSAYEIATKVRLGKLAEAAQILGAYTDHLRRLGATELPISTADGLLAGGLEWDHRDPFDRLLAAQALRHDVRLVSRDTAFGALVGVSTLW